MLSLIQDLNKTFKFVLASQSPRRRELLNELGMSFTIIKKDVPENIRDYWYKKDLSTVTKLKLDSVAEKKQNIIIACDTIVVYKNKVLGKPQNKKQAKEYLQMLSGKKHTVFSCVGIKLIGQKNKKYFLGIEASRVYFRQLELKEINDYVNTDYPYDKAGGYGIQNSGELFVKKINGCYYNVVGLPITRLLKLLAQAKREIDHGFVQ